MPTRFSMQFANITDFKRKTVHKMNFSILYSLKTIPAISKELPADRGADTYRAG